MSREMADLVAAKLSDPVALSALLYRFKHLINFAGFSPHAPAMKTEAFFELANDVSLSDIARFVDRTIHNPDGMLRTSDIWRAADVTEAMPEELRRRPGAEMALTRSMGSLRFKDHIRRVGLISVKGDKLRLWAVRNGPEWEQRGNAAVAAEYLRANPQTNSGRFDTDRWVSDLKADPMPFLRGFTEGFTPRDLWQIDELMAICRIHLGNGVNRTALHKSLTNARYIETGRVDTARGKLPLFIIQNEEKWLAATDDEIAEYYNSYQPKAPKF
jgi:hypothetical protein